jgi:hypothetical protein
MTIIERVARAMFVEQYGERAIDGTTFATLSPYIRDRWCDSAYAAIAAMRKPTEGMILAGDERGDPTKMWYAMIDAALAEHKK